MFIASCGAVDLDELREIDAIPKRRFNGRFVRLKSIRGDLEFSARGMAQTFNENIGGRLTTLAHRIFAGVRALFQK